MPEKVFKIQRDGDGLFSAGGSHPRFSRQGKSWSNIGHLKNHLNQIRAWAWDRVHLRGSAPPETHYLVEYELVEVRRTRLSDFMEEQGLLEDYSV